MAMSMKGRRSVAKATRKPKGSYGLKRQKKGTSKGVMGYNARKDMQLGEKARLRKNKKK